MAKLTKPAPVKDKDLPLRFRATQFAASVAARITETFDRAAALWPELLQFEQFEGGPTGQVKLTLTDLTPVNHRMAYFNVLATGGTYPLSYTFRARTDRTAEFHILPTDKDFSQPHVEEMGFPKGYNLDHMQDGWPENFTRELALNYLEDVKNLVDAEAPTPLAVERLTNRLLPN